MATNLKLAQNMTLVKRANQRLRELEKQGFTRDTAYSKVANWSKRNAQFMGTSKGRIKFRTDLATLYKKDRQTYYREMERVKGFLGLKTSKAGEIRKARQKTIETFKKKYDIELTGDEIKNIFNSELWEQVNAQYSSEEIIDLVQKSDTRTADDIYRILKALRDDEYDIYTMEQILQDKANKGSTRYF